MRVKYDESIDSAYIFVNDNSENLQVGHTYTCDPAQLQGAQINLDFDENFVLVGIEVMNASKHLPQEVLSKIQ